jgi:hypothetical protein
MIDDSLMKEARLYARPWEGLTCSDLRVIFLPPPLHFARSTTRNFTATPVPCRHSLMRHAAAIHSSQRGVIWDRSAELIVGHVEAKSASEPRSTQKQHLAHATTRRQGGGELILLSEGFRAIRLSLPQGLGYDDLRLRLLLWLAWSIKERVDRVYIDATAFILLLRSGVNESLASIIQTMKK